MSENAQLHPPAPVLQVSAFDADEGIFGEVKYAVIANDNTLFQLDPNSGILYPSVSLKGKEGTLLTQLFPILTLFHCACVSCFFFLIFQVIIE